MVSTLDEFLTEAHTARVDEEMPTLYVLGRLPPEPDGTVLQRIGTVCDKPAYKIQPRIWKIVNGNDLRITDDYPEWMNANDEVVTIENKFLDMVVVANPSNEDFSTSLDATTFVTYPPVNN
jgi:hypothetical protein